MFAIKPKTSLNEVKQPDELIKLSQHLEAAKKKKEQPTAIEQEAKRNDAIWAGRR